jgi:hypothetical protein
MGRAAVSTAIGFIGGVAALLAADRTAFAQAGSTGGTLGQTDKSAGGNREAVEPATPPHGIHPKKSDAAARSGLQAAVSVAGRWKWTADCQNGGHWSGGFQLTQETNGEFSGNFLHTTWADIGTITDGEVGNGTISFTRHVVVLQHWTGKLGEGGKRINGSITGNDNCTWEGRKG